MGQIKLLKATRKQKQTLTGRKHVDNSKEAANMSISKAILLLVGRSAATNPHVTAFLRVQYKHILHICNTDNISH